jgi:hypothetical protein
MTLELIMKNIKCGMFQEARRLIEKEPNINVLMQIKEKNKRNALRRQHSTCNAETDESNLEQMPLLVILSLIRDTEIALNLSRLLLEKGYCLSLCDKNGLCAVNYAIALKRLELISLYLDSFNFELNKHKDLYENSLLHYAYASNNENIIRQFANVYAKYYDWNPSSFKAIVNKDGISVQDIIDHNSFLSMNHLNSAINNINNNHHNYSIPDRLYADSNPILICNFINNIYNSHSTMKSEVKFIMNNTLKSNDGPIEQMPSIRNAKSCSISRKKFDNTYELNKGFKINLLKQIRLIKKIKPDLNANKTVELLSRNATNQNIVIHPSNLNVEHIETKIIELREKNFYSRLNMDNLAINNYRSAPCVNLPNAKNKNAKKSWKLEFENLYDDYSVVTSESYRPSTSTLVRSHSSAASIGNFQQKDEQQHKVTSDEPVKATTAINLIKTTTETSHSSLSNHTNHMTNNSNSNDIQHKLKPKLDIYLVPGSMVNKPPKPKARRNLDENSNTNYE